MKAIKFFAAAAVVALSAAFASPVFAQENGNKDENGKVVRGPYLTNRFIDNTFVSVFQSFFLFNISLLRQ